MPRGREFDQGCDFLGAQVRQQRLFIEVSGLGRVGESTVPVDHLILGPLDGFIQQRELPDLLLFVDVGEKRFQDIRAGLKACQDHRDTDVFENRNIFCEQTWARSGHIRHPPEIQNEQGSVRFGLGKPARDIIDGGKVECPDEFDDANIGPPLLQDLLLMGLAAAAGGNAGNVVVGNDAGADVGAAIEHMQIEARRQCFADFESAHAVAMAVETRRKSAKPDLWWQRRDDAATDAALGRNSDAVDPLAGIIVHARTGHHGQHACDCVRRDHVIARHGVHAPVRECRRHDGKIARGDQHGALFEISVQNGIHIAFDDRIVMQKPRYRAIAIAGGAFGEVDRLVDIKIAASKAAQRLPDALEGSRAFDLVNQTGAGNRAGIHHRIERLVVRREADRVEGFAARLNTDGRFDALRPEQVERESKHESFRDRLDREGHVAVADFVDVAVDGGDADAEMCGIRPR